MPDCVLNSSFPTSVPGDLHLNFCFEIIKRNLPNDTTDEGCVRSIWKLLSIFELFFFWYNSLTLTLNCYSAMISMVSFWRHLISLAPKWKTHPNQVMTQHLRHRFRKPSTSQVLDGAGTLVSPPLMLKYKTVVYFPLPHKWSIVVSSERPSGKNRITKGPVHRFVSQINLLVPTWHESPPEVIWEHTLVWK